MKNLNMISRRSFLKAALAASAVSAMALTGCGSAASGTASSAAVSSSAAASGSAAAAGGTFKVGIVNYVDHASLNQIVESVESRLDAIGKEKGITFDYADYYANAQADQSNLNQIGADLVADGVDVIVAVATPTATGIIKAFHRLDQPHGSLLQHIHQVVKAAEGSSRLEHQRLVRLNQLFPGLLAAAFLIGMPQLLLLLVLQQLYFIQFCKVFIQLHRSTSSKIIKSITHQKVKRASTPA